MEIIAIRYGKSCWRKILDGLTPEVEKMLRERLRILTNPNSSGTQDVRKGAVIKKISESLNYLVRANVRIKGLFQEISKLDDDDLVVLVDGETFKGLDIYNWIIALDKMKDGQNVVEAYWSLRGAFSYFTNGRYEVNLFCDFGFDMFIGERDKASRVCRFCNERDINAANKSIFGNPKNSHAISYFLGNDRLFCLEECKECNERFGKTIETDLANYYSYYRAAEERKSRDGHNLTSKGFNYEYANGKMSLYTDKIIGNQPKVGEKMPKDGFMVDLKNEEPVNLHNIYKLLVKYVIACLPNELLPNFRQTQKWVMGEIKPSKHLLPPVYRVETLPNVITPSLCIYVRKDNKKDLPYCVGELRFFENLYVYAIPYCNGNDVFVQDLHVRMDAFVKMRYPKVDFTVENYCDEELKMIITHVKVKGGGDEVMQPIDPTSIKASEEWLARRDKKMMRRFGTTKLPD